MAKIVNFRNEKSLFKQAEEAYNAVIDAGAGIENNIHDALIDLVEIPPWNVIGITIALVRLLKASRQLRKLSIYKDSLCEIGYTLGYIKGKRNSHKMEE